MKRLIVNLLGLATLAACTTYYNPLQDYEQVTPSTRLNPPAAAIPSEFPAGAVERGKYLVGLLGCGSCHTNGALIGEPDFSQLLAGSDVGIAYSNPLAVRHPGIIYPANLTPDMKTGIGSWGSMEIIVMLQTGVDKHTGQTLPIMPWPMYANIIPDDAKAIAAYLLSLPPVSHKVPENVRPGQRARAPFVHFGVYRSKN